MWCWGGLEGWTYVRVLFGCWGHERVSVRKKQGNDEKKKRVGSEAREVTGISPLLHLANPSKKQGIEIREVVRLRELCWAPPCRS
jgi:hypothetical protein